MSVAFSSLQKYHNGSWGFWQFKTYLGRFKTFVDFSYQSIMLISFSEITWSVIIGVKIWLGTWVWSSLSYHHCILLIQMTFFLWKTVNLSNKIHYRIDQIDAETQLNPAKIAKGNCGGELEKNNRNEVADESSRWCW